MGPVTAHVVAVLPEFLLACVVIVALPGPSTALFLHRTVRDGRAAGLAAVAGNEIGVFCWALAAGAGLTALLRANAVLFIGMHVLGAVVLIYLGVIAWRSARRDGGEFGEALKLARLPAGRTPMASFRASLVTVAANPKAAVFAFSFFPQFLPRHGSVFGTAVALAVIQVVVIDGPYCAMIVLLASRARNWLSRDAIRRRLERMLGATLIGLGIDLAASTR
jgi:threonine/homoserine/homoserine lactone efflux protein